MAERRPLASRNTRWAEAAARRLVRASVRPNTISQASIGFALLAGLAFSAVSVSSGGVAAIFLVLAALNCQLRLLCNLLDGMVAIEGGLSEPDGPYWNETPDRISDLIILAGAGIAVGQAWLGLLAGALAILTAYIRELGRAEGQNADFSGPLAKPQRMAILTIGCLVGAIEVWAMGSTRSLLAALAIVTLGTGLTVVFRSQHLIEALKSED